MNLKLFSISVASLGWNLWKLVTAGTVGTPSLPVAGLALGLNLVGA